MNIYKTLADYVPNAQFWSEGQINFFCEAFVFHVKSAVQFIFSTAWAWLGTSHGAVVCLKMYFLVD